MRNIPDDVMEVAESVVPAHDPNLHRTLSLVARGVMLDRTKRQQADNSTLEALRLGYVVLLGMPYEGYRAANQKALASVRDAIAALTGHQPETVQRENETIAAHFLSQPIPDKRGENNGHDQ